MNVYIYTYSIGIGCKYYKFTDEIISQSYGGNFTCKFNDVFALRFLNIVYMGVSSIIAIPPLLEINVFRSRLIHQTIRQSLQVFSDSGRPILGPTKHLKMSENAMSCHASPCLHLRYPTQDTEGTEVC